MDSYQSQRPPAQGSPTFRPTPAIEKWLDNIEDKQAPQSGQLARYGYVKEIPPYVPKKSEKRQKPSGSK